VRGRGVTVKGRKVHKQNTAGLFYAIERKRLTA
jgi:hypothetical protein